MARSPRSFATPQTLPTPAGATTIKAVTDLPARLYGGNAQEVEVSGLDYTLHLDLEKLPESEAPTANAGKWTVLWDEPNNQYKRVEFTSLPGGVGPPGPSGPQGVQGPPGLVGPPGEVGGVTGNVFDTKPFAEATYLEAPQKTLALAGYQVAGDACQILICRRVNAMPTLHEGWIRTTDRFRADGVEDPVNGGYWEYVVPSEGIRIEWFGGKVASLGEAQAQTAFDNIPAFIKAKACVTNNFISTNYRFYKGGPTILFGFPTEMAGDTENVGGYYFDSTIHLDDRTCCLRGISNQGVENNFGSPVFLYFRQNIVGIHIRGHTLSSATLTAPGGHGSVVENLALRANVGTDVNAHGMLVSCKATVTNCRIEFFPGHGMAIVADVTGRAGSQASCWRVDNVWSVTNGRSGFYVAGGDTNVGLGLHCNAINNKEWGIWDDSFLGCVWIAAHTRGNKMGSFNLQGLTAPSVMIGCYSEGGQPPAQIGGRCISIGGLNYETGITPLTGSAGGGAEVQGRLWRGGLEIQPPDHPYEKAADDVQYWLRPDDNYIWRLRHGLINQPHDYKLRTDIGVYTTHFANAGGWEGQSMSGQFCTLSAGRTGNSSYPGELEPNNSLFPKGVFLSSPYGANQGLGQERLLAITATLPTTGVFARGEVLFNRAPTAGGSAGWICTTGGCSGIAAWVSGTRYVLNLYTGVNYSSYVQYGGNFYRAIGTFSYAPVPPPPDVTVLFNIITNKSLVRNTVAESFTVSLAMHNTPLEAGQTASITLVPSPSQTLVDGVDYTPGLAAALTAYAANNGLPPGVTLVGSTLTFDSTYREVPIGLSFATVAKPANGIVDTIIPHLDNPIVTGGSGTPTTGFVGNDPVIQVTDFDYNFTTSSVTEVISEEIPSGTYSRAEFLVALNHQPLPLGAVASVDITLDPASTATDGVDYTPNLAGALAAMTLPAGVTRVGNTVSFSPPSLGASITFLRFSMTRADDALIEAFETIIIKLSNPTLTGATGKTIGIPVESALAYITEDAVSTVPPTHTSGDVMYPEPDPHNPGEYTDGYTWRYLGNTAPVWSPFGNSHLEGTATYNPPSIAAAAVDTIQTMTVTGAALGDLVETSFTVNLAGAVLAAWVSATNTVSYQFRNPTAAPIDLASGTVKCRVRK